MRLTIVFCILIAALCVWASEAPEISRRTRDCEVSSRIPVPVAIEEFEEEFPEPSTEMPTDPIERGECSVELRLYDARVGEPVKGEVHLYRLDVPGNEHWTRGDQLYAKVYVPKEGARVESMPPGWYRPHCLSQRYPGPDLDAFEVSNRPTVRSIPVSMPRTAAAWLIVRDERGRTIEQGKQAGASVRCSSRSSQEPRWLKARELRDPDAYWFGRSRRLRCGDGWHIERVVANSGRFLLGRPAESNWSRRRTIHYAWMAEGRTDIRVKVDSDEWKESTFIGVSVPRHWVLDAVLLPNGERAVDRGARIRARCLAATGESELEIHVRARLEGHEVLRFSFRPFAPPPPHWMTAKRTVKSAAR